MSVLETETHEGSKRKRLDPSVRKRQILEVAAEIFAQKGYRNCSVTDIVEGAGIGRGTFYLYFKSKKEVFLELVERYFSGFAQVLADNRKNLLRVIRDNGNVVAAWRQNLMNILEYHEQNPHLTPVIYQEAFGRDEDFAGRVDELSAIAREQVMGEFAILQKNDVLRPCDPQVATSIILGSTIYLIMEHVVRDTGHSLEELADELVEYHVRALLPPDRDLAEALERATAARLREGQRE